MKLNMKYFSIIFLIICSFILISAVSASDDCDEIESVSAENDVEIIQQELKSTDELLTANESSSSKDKSNPQNIPSDDKRYTEVSLTANDLKTTYKSTDTFNVQVASKYGITYGVKDGMSLKDAQVKLQVKVDGKWKTYKQLANAKGVAKFKLTSLPVGKYDVRFSCNDQNFESTIYKAKLTITKSNPKVTAPITIKEYNKKGNFKITVKDSNKKAINGIKLKVKVYTGKKAKTYNLKTNSKGQAIISTKNLKNGIHKVVISNGDKNSKISKKSLIVIGKPKIMMLALNQQKNFKNGDYFKFHKETKTSQDEKGVYVENLRIYKGSLMAAKTHHIIKVKYTFKNIKGNTIIKTSTSKNMFQTKLIIGYEPVKAEVTYLQA